MSAPAITAHPLQLTFAAACADVYHEENGAAHGAPRRGIAYLIRTDLAVTAASAVYDRSIGQSVWLRFSGGLRQAWLIARDEAADCALLELRPAVISQLALTLRRGLCQPGDVCQTWAAMPTLRNLGQVVQALVHEPLGEDQLRGPALLLHMVAGSERWHQSLAGSPIFQNGYVVGHLRAIASHGSKTLLLCCPSPYIEALVQPASGSQPGPVQPPKASYAPAWYVPRPTEEARSLEWLGGSTYPLLIWAAEGHGKTWFLCRLLAVARAQAGTIGVCINLERLPPTSRTSLEAFLHEVAKELYRQLSDCQVLPSAPGTPDKPEAILGQALRFLAPRRLYLALDQLDVLRETMFQEGFLAWIADLAERSARNAVSGLSGLRLILVSSTAPEWLLRPLAERTFSALAQELLDLSVAQLLALAQLHQLTPSAQELEALHELVGGQPYLARLAMYAAVTRNERLHEVLRPRSAAPMVFDPFLDACLRRVAAQPGLWPTLERVLREQPLDALDRLMLPRLERMGIVRRTENAIRQPQYALRYPLYRRLLER